MSAFANLLGGLPAAVAKGCERLIHPSVPAGTDQLRQSRFIGVMLAGPFFAGCAAALLVAMSFGAAAGIVATCLIMVAGWLLALLVAATGSDRIAAPVALAASTCTVAGLLAVAGGLGSPATFCVVALAFEPFWVNRTRRSLMAGTAAILVAMAIQPVLSGFVAAPSAGAMGWHWLVTFIYSATIFVRSTGLSINSAEGQPTVRATTIEDVLEAVVLRVSNSNEVVAASDKARSLFGLQPNLLLGTGFFDRIHVADRVGYLCALSDLRTGEMTRRFDLRVRLPHEGSADHFKPFNAELAMLDAGMTVVVLRDAGEMAAVRRSLDEATEKADSIDLAKDRFLAAVSHELRTPLNAIIGFSDMMLQEMFGRFDDPRQKEYVGLIRDSGYHLLSVVNSILDISKIESGAYVTYPEEFRFRDTVESCVAMLGMQAQSKGLRLIDDVAPAAGRIVADRRAVQQMLINLVSNAIKFTPEGGQVTIGGERVGSRLHFWVSDTGIGIAEDDLCRLGRPFVQVQNDYTRRYEGTGLGLSLVKGMVTLHKGTMSIESAPGEGTTVSISLPVEGIEWSGKTGELLPLPAAKVRENANASLRKTA